MDITLQVLITIIVFFVGLSSGKCPCENPLQCEPVKVTHKNEIFLFSVSKNNWRDYDWSHITSVAMFGYYDPELMCYAHSKNVRVLLKGDFPLKNLSNDADRKKWVSEQLTKAKDFFMDGINIDVEGALDKEHAPLLTQLVNETSEAFHNAFPHSQVSFDAAWSADCIDGRCYDYAAISKVVDHLFVMSYDEQSQIKGDCIAKANSPYNKTIEGLETFLKLGIEPQKMILGVPWYGYDYPCLALSKEDVCSIKHVPFRGVNCSDAAGHQKCYSGLMSMVRSNSIEVHWSDEYKAPFFNYKDSSSGQTHQVWFDNPKSLKLRYDYAKEKNFGGVGPWNSDCLDYKSAAAKTETKAMWDTINEFAKS